MFLILLVSGWLALPADGWSASGKKVSREDEDAPDRLVEVKKDSPAASEALERLNFHIANQTYAYNIERHLDERLMPKGNTLIGNILKPYFRYHLNPNVAIDAGAVLNMPFGDDNRVDKADPLVSFHFQFYPGMMITAGTINRNHALLDALFNNDVLQFTNPVEQGFQFLINKKNIKSDLWINWEQKETATRKENFNVGHVLQLMSHGFMVENQVYWDHFGGQLNSAGPAVNSLARAFGGGYIVPINRDWDFARYIYGLGATMHYVHSEYYPGNEAQPNLKDSGSLARAWVNILGTEVHYLRWRGGSQNFYTLKGDPMYRADAFDEFGISKTFWVTDNIGLVFAYKGQYVDFHGTHSKNELQHEELVGVRWEMDFPLFRDYFKHAREDRQASQFLRPERGEFRRYR